MKHRYSIISATECVALGIVSATTWLVLGIISAACMGPQHFNSLAMSEEKETGDIVPLLDIRAGSRVADVGAGGGYYSLKLARAVGPKGEVFAVDISPQSIDCIANLARESGLTNLHTVLARPDDSMLSPGSIDLVLVRNAYHDISGRVAYFRRLRGVLRAGGRVVIVDYDPKKLGFFRKLIGHAIAESQVTGEMHEAGYERVMTNPNLPAQSFNVFVPEPMRE